MSERPEPVDRPPLHPVPRVRRPVHRLHPRVLSAYAVALGLGMMAASGVWALVMGQHPPGDWFPARHWIAYVVAGMLVGALFAVTAYRLLDAIPSLRRIELMLFATLDMDAMRPHHAVIFGLAAGIPEEMLFRGAIQPALGLIPASIIFGALHALTPAYFVYAALAGGLLGGLAQWSGGLWAPIAAHTIIDLIMFLLLIRRWRSLRRGKAADVTLSDGEDA